ncbi:hypothetical protein [Cognatishimia sp. F0-27]|uniref:hypothetical protein n=1 Tax=Cognatishimia sp. F0-27 TaxID=2816855 RepID=UPI001D0CCEB8|nr:hypothetical protein [Cognatishimia sp. F0-27]MCC1492294.1 hypothetical protein [Cognatishimia sp. F0-27]
MGLLTAAAALYAVIAIGNLCFQVALVAGAPWGRLTQGGQVAGRLPKTGRVLAAVSFVVVALQAAAILSVAELVALDWPRWAGWVSVGVTALSTVANALTPSRAERRLWFPLLLLQFCAALVVMAASG